MAGRKPTFEEQLQQRWAQQDNDVAAIAERLAAKTDNRLVVSEHGKTTLRGWLRRFSVHEIIDAVDASFEVYLRFSENDPDLESWETAFRKVPIFISIARAEPYQPHIRQLLYIQGIIRNSEGAPRINCLWFLEHLVEAGADIDEIESRAKRMTPEDFKDFYDDWLTQRGRSI